MPLDRRRIEDVFEAALEREPPAREAFLRSECGDDAELRREVESLLAAHDRAGVLEADALGLVGSAARIVLEDPGPGTRVGPWRLGRELGHGGMAVVYMAERDDGQFHQRVAVKVIRGFGDPFELERRFRAERQILAALDHPHIARLLDGGVTGDHRPYLVMEYVNGLPVDDYCDRRRLNVDERLRLFCEVGRAVQHAHRRLVVHRDLKPSNILVRGDGDVKLLDFGIAKILDPAGVDHTETTPRTRTGMRLMTPEYASPEQVRGEGVTTANDVYALGVVLYELLAGRRPFPMEGRTPGECERMVLEDEPPRPSALVIRPVRPGKEDSARTPTPELVARDRRTSPRRLHRRLRGDLDRIVLMALRKEPERRYASVEQMVEDVERHLDGRPVRATGDGLGYRARKFMLRYRWAVGAAALVVTSLAGGVVATTWQARRAAEQAALASTERDRAAEEARKAARVAALMVDLFRLSDPATEPGRVVTAREVLDRGTERIERELADEPDVQAELLGAAARIYASLGVLDRAESLARQALALRVRLTGPSSPETAEALAQTGDLLAELGRSDEAVGYYRRSIALREALHEERDTALARTKARLAWEIRAAGEDDEAGRLFEDALVTQRAVLGEDHPEVASTLLGLAATWHDRGRFDEAEALFQNVLARSRDGSGPTAHPAVATALLNVGMIRRLREQFVAAEPLVREGLEMRESLYDAAHPDVIEALGQWGAELYELGRYREADSAFQEGMARAAGVLSPVHPTVEALREGLAEVGAAQGRWGRAAARFDSVRTSRAARRGESHPAVALVDIRWGDALLRTGDREAARARYRSALGTDGTPSAAGGVYDALALDGLARLALEEGEPDEAERFLGEAETRIGRLLEPEHRYALAVQSTRARLLLARGRADEAQRLLTRILGGETALRPEPHPEIGRILSLMGEARLASGDSLGARDALYRARANQVGLPTAHPDVRRVEALLRTALGPDVLLGMPR